MRVAFASWLLLCVGVVAGLPPAREVTAEPVWTRHVHAALADAEAIADERVRYHTRYQSLHAVPLDRRQAFLGVLTGHVMGFSKHSDAVGPRLVQADLVAFNLLDYGISPAVYDRLDDFDPYYTITRRDAHGQKIRAFAPWLPGDAVLKLAKVTDSRVPLLRADWFFFQTAIQEGRGKAGYYDFLGVGDTLADFQRLVAVDPKVAETRKVYHSVVKSSGVAVAKSRGIVRLQGLDGGYWQTLDGSAVKGPVEEQNPLRNLPARGAFKPKAFEAYGVLPCGMYAFFLANADGKRQDTAPPDIATDKNAAGNVATVHIGKSCITCHVEGLRPIKDHIRAAYATPLDLFQAFNVGDYDEQIKLRQQYFGNLGKALCKDTANYADALKEINGMTPFQYAKGFAEAWDGYAETDLTIIDVAREADVPAHVFAQRREALRATGQLDPVVRDLTLARGTMLREHVQEAWPVILQIAHPPPLKVAVPVK